MTDFYQILGVEFAASQEQIKAAYKKLIKIHHPDLNSNSKESIEKFKKITEAYQTLKDSEKRKRYDLVNGGFKYTSIFDDFFASHYRESRREYFNRSYKGIFEELYKDE